MKLLNVGGRVLNMDLMIEFSYQPSRMFQGEDWETPVRLKSEAIVKFAAPWRSGNSDGESSIEPHDISFFGADADALHAWMMDNSANVHESIPKPKDIPASW